MSWIMESERLLFRKITVADYEHLRTIMQNIEIMYAWEHAFTDEEVMSWIEKNLQRYQQHGFSYFATLEKSGKNFLGVMGPLVEEVNNVSYTGIAYILDKKYWGKGFAIEGARTSMNYAFENLQANKVIAHIRPNNLASRKVAEKLGMAIEFEYIKHYRGQELPHLIYSKEKK